MVGRSLFNQSIKVTINKAEEMQDREMGTKTVKEAEVVADTAVKGLLATIEFETIVVAEEDVEMISKDLMWPQLRSLTKPLSVLSWCSQVAPPHSRKLGSSLAPTPGSLALARLVMSSL
jgi:hypothetical protein